MCADYRPIAAGGALEQLLPIQLGSFSAKNKGNENRFWSSYKTQHTFECVSGVNKVALMRCNNVNMAASKMGHSQQVEDICMATIGSSLVLYSLKTKKIIKSISKGIKGSCYCGIISSRNGRLGACGSDDGNVFVYDLDRNALLRKFKNGHGGKHVRSVAFFNRSGDFSMDRKSMKGSHELVSGGDDGVVKLWDIGIGKAVTRFEGHTDYVRCLTTTDDAGYANELCPGMITRGVDNLGPDTVHDEEFNGYGRQSNGEISNQVVEVKNVDNQYHRSSNYSGLVVSGSYDHTVRLWDPRQGSSGNKVILNLQHSSPIYDVQFLPGNGLIGTASGNTLCVWNLFMGKLIGVNTNHQKAITSITLCPYIDQNTDGTIERKETRILTGSLDGKVRVICMETYRTKHITNFPGPVSAVSTSDDGGIVAVGLTNNLLCIQRRKKAITPFRKRTRIERDGALTAGSYRYFLRGTSAPAAAADFKLAAQRRLHLPSYDRLLRRFRYRDALTNALATRKPEIVMVLLMDLAHRNALRIAIGGRSEMELEPLLSFLVSYAVHPRYCRLLQPTIHRVLDTYTPAIGSSPMVDLNLRKLREMVLIDIKMINGLCQLMGCLEPLLATNISNNNSSS